MLFAEQIFGGVQIRRSQKKLMLIHVCNQNSFTLIFRYHYSIEELRGKEEAGAGQNSDVPVPLLNRGTGRERGSGGGAKPVEKPGKKRGAGRFAHPLRGAEVLVAVRGPSPGEGGGKKTGSRRRA